MHTPTTPLQKLHGHCPPPPPKQREGRRARRSDARAQARHARAAGSAADDPWSVAKFDVDPTWGGMYYAGVLEPVPGRLVLVYARSGSINAGFNNSVGAQVIEEWMLDQTWPGDAL